MNPDHSISILGSYITDMVAVERDILNAVHGQLKDHRVTTFPGAQSLLQKIAEETQWRLENNETLAEVIDGKWGSRIKEALAATTGALAGIYGMVRTHPVSKMLRDDHVALNLAATAYGMFYTAAVAFDEDEVATMALEHLKSLPPRITALIHLLPAVIVQELGQSNSINPSAGTLAVMAIDSAWSEIDVELEEGAASNR
jgi:hypothetical protein